MSLFDPTCVNCNYTLRDHSLKNYCPTGIRTQGAVRRPSGWRNTKFKMVGDPPGTLCAHCNFTRKDHFEHEGDLLCVKLKNPCPEPFTAMLIRAGTRYRRADRTIWEHILSGPV